MSRAFTPDRANLDRGHSCLAAVIADAVRLRSHPATPPRTPEPYGVDPDAGADPRDRARPASLKEAGQPFPLTP